MPKIIKSGFSQDERGRVVFCNDFDFKGIKRFYMLENASQEVIRAFHGHLKEEKYMSVISGKAIICVAPLSKTGDPDKEKEVHKFVLSAENPEILHVPGGFANGFKALEDKTKVIVFSTSSLEDSKKDNYNLPHDCWGKEIWN